MEEVIKKPVEKSLQFMLITKHESPCSCGCMTTQYIG